MDYSFLVYCILLIGGVCCAFFAERKNNPIWLIIIIGLFSIVAGYRAESVGKDTISYISIFKQIWGGELQASYGEYGFKYMVSLLGKISLSPNFSLLIIAMITHTLIVFRIWDFKDKISFPIAVFCYYIQFYSFSLNGVRQMLAVSLVFFATRYIRRKEHILFFILTTIAALFHISALMGMVFFVVDIAIRAWLFDKKAALMQFIVLGILGCTILIVGYEMLAKGVERLLTVYLKDITLDFGFMLPFKICLLIVTSYLVFSSQETCVQIYFEEREKSFITGEYLYNKTYGWSERSGNKILLDYKKENCYETISLYVYYLIGLLVASSGYFYVFLNRMGLYFYLFEAVYMGRLLKYNKNKILFAFILILFAYIFIVDMIGNGQGQLPYLFIWQQ